MNDINWTELIELAKNSRRPPISAHTYRNKKWNSFSKPVALACDDGNDYVVKGRQCGKVIVNEQIVGLLARHIGAPVPEVRVVNVPKELIELQTAEMSHITPGLSHGSRLEGGCTDRLWLSHWDIPENKPRFAALAVLYGWIHPNDNQLIYRLDKPPLVFSVDHGNFFPGGPHWSASSLRAANHPQPLPDIVNGCQLTSEHIQPCLDRLAEISEGQIAEAVAAPCDEWAITMDERIAVAQYLDQRRHILVESIA